MEKTEENAQGIYLKDRWSNSDLYCLKGHSKHFIARQRVEGVEGVDTLLSLEDHRLRRMRIWGHDTLSCMPAAHSLYIRAMSNTYRFWDLEQGGIHVFFIHRRTELSD